MSESRVELLDLLPDAVIVLEEGPTVALVNRAASSLLARPKDDLEGRPCGEVLALRDPSGRDFCDCSPVGSRKPMAKGAPERDYELRRPDGTHLPVTVRAAYEKDASGVIRRVVCVVRDARARRGMDLRTVEIISTVSHEIRSPLTSIKGFTKTLLDRWDRFEDAVKREMLAAVNQDADRVTRLLGELLDVSRLEAGRLRIRPEKVDLTQVAGAVVDAHRRRSDRHELAVHLPASLVVWADRDKVRQVLTNLVENALKYTTEGRVTVAADVDGDWARVEVSDQGDGLSSQQIPRLFRKFSRGDEPGSPSGTGLGLYICKGLIEAHGGQIGARSGRGAGSTFWFTLPTRPDAA